MFIYCRAFDINNNNNNFIKKRKCNECARAYRLNFLTKQKSKSKKTAFVAVQPHRVNVYKQNLNRITTRTTENKLKKFYSLAPCVPRALIKI